MSKLDNTFPFVETADHFQRVAHSCTCSKYSTLTQPLGFSFVSLLCLEDYQSVKHIHYIPEHYMDFHGEPTNCCTQFHFGGQGALCPAAEVHI
jgi:hypothetical protein